MNNFTKNPFTFPCNTFAASSGSLPHRQEVDLSRSRCLANLSITSAHTYLPQNLAHCSALNPLPWSLNVGFAPEINWNAFESLDLPFYRRQKRINLPANNKILAHLVLPWRAAFINGVKPDAFLASTSMSGHLWRSMFKHSVCPSNSNEILRET